MLRNRKTLVAMALVAALVFLVPGIAIASGRSDSGGVADQGPVTLTMIAPGFEKTFAAGFQDDPVMNAIEERLGIRLHITPENAIADVNARLSTLMAARALPDLVYTLEANIRQSMLSARLALNLEPYLDQLSNFEDNRPGSFDIFRQLWNTDADGNRLDGLYWVALNGSQGDLYRSNVGFFVRWDLYAELGYPEIDDYYDYIDLAQAMLKLEPQNKDGRRNYGISAWFGQSGGFGPWALDVPFNWDGGFQGGVSANFQFDPDSGTLSASMTNPDSVFWYGVEWWNAAYRAGIVDPNSFTQTWPDYLEQIAGQNRMMIGWAGFAVAPGEAAFVADGTPEKGYVALPSPLTERSTYGMVSYSPTGNRPFMVSAESQHPEKAVELLNHLASWEGTINVFNGLEGVHWDIVDGRPQLRQEVIDGLQSDPDYNLKSGVYKYHNMAGMGSVDTWPEYNVPARFTYLPELLATRATQVEQAASDYFGVEYIGQAVAAGKDSIFLNTHPDWIAFQNLPPAAETNRVREVQAQLSEIWFTDVYEAVLAETPADFARIKAAIINSAKRVGGDWLFEYQLARFNGEAE